MSHQIFLQLATVLLTFKIAFSQCPITSLPADWIAISVPRSDYCYAIGNSKENPVEARRKCWAVFRGHLARFHDVKTLQSVAKKITLNTGKIWIDLIAKSNSWTWSDGSAVESKVLDEFLEKEAGVSSGGTICGALLDKPSPKFTRWTSDLCNANHEFICQAPKLNAGLGNCVNSTFRLNGKCLTVSSEALTFQSADDYCKQLPNGRLAALENLELAVATANYFERKRTDIHNIEVWLDIIWNEKSSGWEHLDGRKVTVLEENWDPRSQKIFTNGRSSVVLDQQSNWKWRTRQPDAKAYALCEVLYRVEGKEIRPDLNPDATTTTTSASKFLLDVKTLGLIIAGIGIVFIFLLIIICVLCYKKTCCLRRRKIRVRSDDFGTPVNFMNPEYGNTVVGNTARPRLSDTPTRELPNPPLAGDETYATITDHHVSPPISTGDIANVAISSLPRTHYSTQITTDESQESIATRDLVPTSSRGRQMTSSTGPSPNLPSMTSPYYAKMKKQEVPKTEEAALHYAELAFQVTDEDDQFKVSETSHVEEHQDTDQ